MKIFLATRISGNNINNRNIITKVPILVIFDVVNMFPSTYNVSGLEAISEILNNRESDFPILDALKLWLECNNSVLNNTFYLHVVGTAEGSHTYVLLL